MNRGHALPFERRVDQREPPARRWRDGHDCVLAAQEAQVLAEIAAVVNARQRRAEAELHVCEETMLCIRRPHRDRTRVAVLDDDVDVAQRGIERAGIGIANRRRKVDRRRFRLGTLEDEARIAGPSRQTPYKVKQVGRTCLKSRSRCAEHEQGPRASVADYADTRPDADGPAQSIRARRHEQDAARRRSRYAIDRALQRGTIVADSIGERTERLLREIDRLRIVRQARCNRTRPAWCRSRESAAPPSRS